MFDKKALSIDEQINQLSNRGLLIDDLDFAKQTLNHISYYRLAGYWWSMQSDKENHIFKPNSKFSDAVALYNFDTELRNLLFEVIEKIEISLRTKLIYYCSIEFDAWWFQNTSLFIDTAAVIRTLSSIEEEIERSKEIFIKEHFKKHKDDLRFPPAWKTLELTSFGSLSKLYGNLHNYIKSKDLIAEDYKTVNHTYLKSWLMTIAQIRNFCAHHSRLWNKNLPGRPKLLSNPPSKWISNVPKENELDRLYIHLCCMRYLLNEIQPTNTFSNKLSDLLKKYPSVDENALGMKPNWQNEPLWQELKTT